MPTVCAVEALQQLLLFPFICRGTSTAAVVSIHTQKHFNGSLKAQAQQAVRGGTDLVLTGARVHACLYMFAFIPVLEATGGTEEPICCY